MSSNSITGYITQQKEAITSALKEFYKKDSNIDMKTDLDAEEITLTNNIEYLDKWVYDKWGIDMGLDKYTEGYKAKKVSHKRGGRTEMKDVLSSQKVEEPTQKDLVQKLMGV